MLCCYVYLKSHVNQTCKCLDKRLDPLPIVNAYTRVNSSVDWFVARTPHIAITPISILYRLRHFPSKLRSASRKELRTCMLQYLRHKRHCPTRRCFGISKSESYLSISLLFCGHRTSAASESSDRTLTSVSPYIHRSSDSFHV